VKKIESFLVTLLITFTGYGAQAATTPPDGSPSIAAHAEAGGKPAKHGILSGKIVETMNSAGYTYVLLDTGADKVWAASTEASVTVGQRVSVVTGEVMSNFTSNTLNRTFDRIYFVNGIFPEGSLNKDANLSQGVSGSGRTVVTDAHVENVTKAPGGYTVEEIFARSTELGGQQVKVHGRVVKFTGGIMGTNWLHIQDGTPGDLTVTTDTSVTKGDLVTVEGVLSTDRDFGAGYRYPAIIEKATVTRE